MDSALYRDIVATITSYVGLSRDCEKIVIQKYPDISKRTLGSIVSLEYQKRMRRKHTKTKLVSENYFRRYNNGEHIVEIARDVDIAPALVARLVVEEYCAAENTEQQIPASRNYISQLLKDTTKITDKRLSIEVFEAVIFDSLYGPVADCIKHSFGEEYEQRLKSYAMSINLSFRDELQLRQCGFDKTPDLKLEIPIAINGYVVNWIESKASFGDFETHKGYIKDQFMSYWNRFGPGLVIYWFGYVESIVNKDDSTMFIIRDKFPIDEIQFMK